MPFPVSGGSRSASPATLYAVLFRVPNTTAPRTPQSVRLQREVSRWALAHSAKLCGAPEDGWTSDADSVPVARDGLYWSVSHKRHWVAAVIADQPVGIDIERIEPRRSMMHEAVADDLEWQRLGQRDWPAFFRVWTAKEATLKAHGVGIGELLACRVVDVSGDAEMTLAYRGRTTRVSHHYFDDHIAAVTRGWQPIEWRVMEGPTPSRGS